MSAKIFVDQIMTMLGGEVKKALNPELDEQADREHRAQKRAEARAAIYGRAGA